jgi:ABC-type transport system involved in multi-copper enzyme maturation permease subunit
MSISATRIRAILTKELRDYRRNRLIITTMAVMPIIFMVLPTIQIFAVPATAASPAVVKRVGLSLLYLLLVPTIVPAALAAYSVVGEREQGTLEPVLTTPLRREEFILAKFLAALTPTLAIAYAMYGIFLACAAMFAQPPIQAAIFQGPHLLIQLLFTPLLASWSIWAGIAISTRTSDVRVAQQLAVLASLPPLAVTALVSFEVISPTLNITLALAAILLLIDLAAWRLVSAIFDRERLITTIRT